MRKFKDVAHLYRDLSCYDSFNDEKVILSPNMVFVYSQKDAFDQLKPILRRLSSLTEDEKNHIECMSNVNIDKNYITELSGSRIETSAMVEAFTYLLSLHIDLFGLIDSGEAIEKTN